MTSKADSLLQEIDLFLSTQKDPSLETSLLLDRSRSRSSSKRRRRSKSRDRTLDTSSSINESREHRGHSRSRSGERRRSRSKSRVTFEPKSEESVHHYSPVQLESPPSTQPASHSSKPNISAISAPATSSSDTELTAQRGPPSAVQLQGGSSSRIMKSGGTSKGSILKQQDLLVEEEEPTDVPDVEEREPVRESRSKHLESSVHATTPTRTNYMTNDKSLHVSELMSPEPNTSTLRSRKSRNGGMNNNNNHTFEFSDESDSKKSPHLYSPLPSFEIDFSVGGLSPPSLGFQEQVEMMKQRIRRLIDLNNSVTADLLSSTLHISSPSHASMTPSIRGLSKIIDDVDSPVAQRHMPDL